VGHLLQGRFKAILVEKERHLLELVRYVVLNPVRAGLVLRAGDWAWSNYSATAGLARRPRWLETDWTIAQFGKGAAAIAAYREFVAAGQACVEQPWKRLAGQLFLGSQEFRIRMRALAGTRDFCREVPRSQRRALRPSLPEVVRASARVLGLDPLRVKEKGRTRLRLLVAYIGRWDSMARLGEIASTFGVSVTSAHEIAASARRLSRQELEFRVLLRRVRSEIRKNET